MATAQAGYWRDSVSLWARAVALDGDNDVAIYNLGQALEAASLPDAAIQQYARLVALVPDHALAQRALAGLQADKAQTAADQAAQAGRLAQAVAGYDRVLQLDPARVQARTNRGMARVALGDIRQGVPDLEAGVAAGSVDPAVANALAFGWVAMNRTAEAIALLTRIQTQHPNDVGLANNLARLLLTAEPVSLRDPGNALAIAAQLTQMTGGRDPRLLDTLAMAFTAAGQPVDARQALERAVSLARERRRRGTHRHPRPAPRRPAALSASARQPCSATPVCRGANPVGRSCAVQAKGRLRRAAPLPCLVRFWKP